MAKTNSIQQMRRSLSEMSAIMYNIYVDWFVSERPVTESEHIACDMYRMMLFKAKSIWLMSEGVTITPQQKDVIKDPSTIYPVLRSMYEMLFLFRCIFASSKNDVERELLLKLWKIRGNNNLILIPNNELDEESQSKKKNKKAENKALRVEVRELMDKLHLPASIRDDIESCINNASPSLKGFMFEHCEHCDAITKFRDLNFSDSTMGVDLSSASYIYSDYSAHSHPSYLGVKHFEDMYNSYAEDNFMKEILEYTCVYLGRFMMDFYIYKESYRPFYDKNASDINNLMKQLPNGNQQS